MNIMKRTNVQECQSVSEAMVKSGLDWNPIQAPVYLGDGTRIAGKTAILREDNYRPLGIVGKNYEPVSNAASFNCFDTLINQGVVELSSAGYTSGGSRVFLEGKIVNSTFSTNSDDESELYLMAFNSHDGSSALKFFVSAYRFVCENMFRLLQQEAKHFSYARHTSGSIENWKINSGLLVDKIANAQKTYIDRVHDLQSKYMGAIEFTQFVEKLVGENKKKLEILNNNFLAGRGSNSTRYTRWGALNAVTEYTTHDQAVRGDDKSTARFLSGVIGSGNALNSKAYGLLLA